MESNYVFIALVGILLAIGCAVVVVTTENRPTLWINLILAVGFSLAAFYLISFSVY